MEEGEGDEELPPPIAPVDVALAFTFGLFTPPLPPPPEEGAEPVVAPSLEGTFFAFKWGDDPEQPPLQLAHPLSGEGGPPSSSAELSVGEPAVRWLVQQNGVLQLSLRRPVEGDPEGEELMAVPLDVSGLLFARLHASASFGEGAAPLPSGVAELLLGLEVKATASCPMLSPELASALNPMMISLVRIDGLPSSYTGNPYKAPYQELSQRCLPVYIQWRLLDTDHRSAGRSHAERLTFAGERRLILAGAMGAAELSRRLREEPFVVEVHDRDPLPPTSL